MAEEKILTLNMRKDLAKTRRGRKANKVISVLRERIQKIFKEQRIVIDKTVNDKVWKSGMKNPPAKLKLKVTKVDDETVRVELEK